MKLLVATDGSENALRAVAYAASLIARLRDGGTITLISVHDDVALRHARRFVGKQVVDEYLRELSEQDLANARQLLESSGIEHDVIVRTGHVSSEIAETADNNGYEMLLLGPKGRGGVKDLLLGSVARRVSEIARTAVLLVK